MIRKSIGLINILSIDVAIGAVCSALFFGRVNHTHVDPVTAVVLALSVWVIYTADHLLDAGKIKSRAAALRHQVHQQYYRILRNAIIGVTGLVAVLLFFLPEAVLLHGMALAVMVLLYLFFHPRLKGFKEICIAILYTAGVLVPSLKDLRTLEEIPFALLAVFALTAFINLVMFSWYSQKEDLQDGHASIVTRMGNRSTQWLFYGLFLTVTLITILHAFAIPYLVLWIMNIGMVIIYMFPAYFAFAERYRIWGDAMFIIPILYLLI